jgi:hypothetical protein
MEARKKDSELVKDDMRIPYARVCEHACISELAAMRVTAFDRENQKEQTDNAFHNEKRW